MPRFRARQILEWVYERGVADPAAMSNLSKADRDRLSREVVFLSGETVLHRTASDGTEKLLIEWDDGDEARGLAGASTRRAEHEAHAAAMVEAGESSHRLPMLARGGDTTRQTECVMIPSLDLDPSGRPARRTACVSSQIGCPVGCRFCASGLGGLDGNLSAGRIVEQVWRMCRLPGVGRITNVVFMGMGEPLSNFQSVTRAIRTICSLWALGISARKVTISTVGLPKAIEKLAEQFELPVTLALSLHAPDDETRRHLIPWAEYTTIDELLAACGRWFDKTGREITLEYTLLRDVNDAPAQARRLAEVAKTIRANVNLIRYNEVASLEFRRPRDEDVAAFQRVLRGAGVNVHVRASRGRDIEAACGQLRHEGSKGAGAAS